ncbi:MAG TPA: saccharopine dehydrogenase C-terminal domain-containing protein [Gemmatimonadales bacterium]|nr:saccharopine dehydrogenase C-terminal domain-containing protein [Gemmatimonadales bacterium]
MTRNVLVLGAGLVARPLLRYLLTQRQLQVCVATNDAPRARLMMGEHPRGRVSHLDVHDAAALAALVDEADAVVSLLPSELNVLVARTAIARRKPMVNTSYAAPEMLALDQEATAAGVLLLNEMGLDPGIDHMSAAATVRRLKFAGGTIVNFVSACGGFPAPDANTNPWGYKFSWSPRGVMLAGRRPARFLRGGIEVPVPGNEIFANAWKLEVEGEGVFDIYPNTDSLRYIGPYGLDGAEGVFRGTLRYPGWCATMHAAVRLGLFDIEPREWPEGTTYADFTSRLLPGRGSVLRRAAEYLDLSDDSDVLARLEWAGLFSDRPLPERQAAPIDVFGNRLVKLMMYQPGERDQVLLKHIFTVRYPDGSREEVRSRLVELGDPWGDTAMAKTVSLTAGIGTRLIVEKGIQAVGVQIPTLREIYEPVLEELGERGIALREVHIKSFRGPFASP